MEKVLMSWEKSIWRKMLRRVEWLCIRKRKIQLKGKKSLAEERKGLDEEELERKG